MQSETIDFGPLVDAKLFGIFGPVGSGKSTILEAIMFVLFDRSNRLNKSGDDRYYNMMNLQSNEMIIDFIFKAGTNNRVKYRFYFLARRNSRDFSKVEVKDRSYYQWSKNDWQPLTKPEVLGMTYENFMQTVIIPQGKFREFIDQKPKDRTLMLKELFHLDRFDIAQQSFSLLGNLRERCKFIDGQLSQYSEISKVLLKQLNKEILSLNSQLDKKTKQEHKLSEELTEMQLLQHQYSELKEVTDRLTILESESTFFRNKQSQLNRFSKVQNLFKDKIAQQQQLLIKAKSKEQELSQLVASIDLLEKEVLEVRANWEQAKLDYGKKDQLLQEITDLELIARLKSQKALLRISNETINAVNKKQDQLSQNIQVLEKEIGRSQTASTKRTDLANRLQQLQNLDLWWNRFTEKQDQNRQLDNELKILRPTIEKLETKSKRLKSQLKDRARLKQKIAKQRDQIQTIKLRHDWSEHAQHLSEGKPCPLCGSLNHPDPITLKSDNRELEKAQNELTDLELELENQTEILKQIEILSVQIHEKSAVEKTLRKRAVNLGEDLKNHQTQYPNGKMPKSKPAGIDQRMSKVEKEIAITEKEISMLASRLELQDKYQKQALQFQEQLEISKLEKGKLQGKIDELAGMIKLMEVSSYEKRSESQLLSLIDQHKSRLQGVERAYQQTLDKLSRTEKLLNHQRGLLQSTDSQVNDIKTQSIALESEMVVLCKKHGLKGLIEVQNILNLNLNPEQEQSELERYRTDLNTMQSRQQSLRKKMGKKTYSEHKHLELTKTHDDLKVEINQLRHQHSSKQHTQLQYQNQLTKKDKLTKELSQLSFRKDQVQEISNLLRGNGFINFISSVYLQNLCRAANTRFQKLTSNQLSLELSESNEFLVRDHLNEGKTRLLKTLSGGQIFQASLSLALSLAENVKKLNKSEQSFFFLDEGFGSLDRASLHLVFETLKSLQRENRVVGVISHVEELQTEIDTYLTINQDPAKGSVVTRSWE